MKQTSDKSQSKIIKDFGYIKIGEKFYEVNESKASLNIIKSSLTLSNFFREYESIVKTIEVYNNAKDELLGMATLFSTKNIRPTTHYHLTNKPVIQGSNIA